MKGFHFRPERILIVLRDRIHLVCFGLGNFMRERSSQSFAIFVDIQHDGLGFFLTFPKESCQYQYNEIHRSEVVVQEHYRIVWRGREVFAFFLRGRRYDRAMVVITIVVIMLAHFSISPV
jgi:hypothetical protein